MTGLGGLCCHKAIVRWGLWLEELGHWRYGHGPGGSFSCPVSFIYFLLLVRPEQSDFSSVVLLCHPVLFWSQLTGIIGQNKILSFKLQVSGLVS